MKKAPRSVYVCQECGAQSAKWLGRCNDCGGWNTFQEEMVAPRAQMGMALGAEPGLAPVSLDQVDLEQEPRFTTGLEELDRVLGGGVVPGSLVLLGGPPGIGKSTLLLQIARRLTATRAPILYVSGEESARQIRMRAERLSVPGKGILLVSETRLEAIEAHIHKERPGLVFVDSIQTMFRADLAPAPGSVTQVRECSASLMRLAKAHGVPIILVGHVTKGGEIAGPRVLEHLVDTVLYFEGDGLHNVRALRSVKNRFGSTQEIGLFRMGAQGLDSIPDASAFFLSQRAGGGPGSIVFPSMEGTRPLLVEVQALVSENPNVDKGVPPTRRAVGMDGNRLSLLLAVLQKRVKNLKLGHCDVYVNVAGGLKLIEPALDLPLALAVVSSKVNKPVDSEFAAVGELGLGGEVRAVTQLESRLKELAKLGFSRCLVPEKNLQSLGAGFDCKPLELIGVKWLVDALAVAGLDVPPPAPRESGRPNGNVTELMGRPRRGPRGADPF